METKKLDLIVKKKSGELLKESSKKLDELFNENTCSNLFDLSLVAIEEMERLRFYKSLLKDTFEQAKKRSFLVANEDFKYWHLDQWNNRKQNLSVEVRNMIEKVAEASRMDIAVKFHTFLKSLEEKEIIQGDLFNIRDEKTSFEPYTEVMDRIKKNF